MGIPMSSRPKRPRDLNQCRQNEFLSELKAKQRALD
jgi:hypothetical protein